MYLYEGKLKLHFDFLTLTTNNKFYFLNAIESVCTLHRGPYLFANMHIGYWFLFTLYHCPNMHAYVLSSSLSQVFVYSLPLSQYFLRRCHRFRNRWTFFSARWIIFTIFAHICMLVAVVQISAVRRGVHPCV